MIRRSAKKIQWLFKPKKKYTEKQIWIIHQIYCYQCRSDQTREKTQKSSSRKVLIPARYRLIMIYVQLFNGTFACDSFIHWKCVSANVSFTRTLSRFCSFFFVHCFRYAFICSPLVVRALWVRFLTKYHNCVHRNRRK